MRRIDDSAHKGNSLKPVTRAATGLHTCHFSGSSCICINRLSPQPARY